MRKVFLWTLSFVTCASSLFLSGSFLQAGPGGGTVYRKYRNWHHYSDTRVTPEGPPHLTCIDGTGDYFVVGSKGSGLFRFFPLRRTFEPFPGADLLSGKQITAVSMGAAAGEVFVGTFFSGLYHRRADGTWEALGDGSGLPGSRVTALARTTRSVLVGTDGGLVEFVAGRLVKTPLKEKIESLAVDSRTGRIYAGMRKSRIAVYDPVRRIWSTVRMAVEPPVSFKHLAVEPSGDILVGTFLGLFRIDGRTGSVTELTRNAEKKLVSCLYVDPEGRSYVGIFGKGKGIHLLSGNELKPLFRGYAGFSEAVAYRRTRRGDNIIISFGRLWHFTDSFVQSGLLKKAVYRGPGAVGSPAAVPPVAVPSEGARVASRGLPAGNFGPGRGVAGLPPPPPVGPVTAVSAGGAGVTASKPVVPAAGSDAAVPARVDGLVTVIEGERILSLAQSIGRLWAGGSSGSLFLWTPNSRPRSVRRFGTAVSVLHYSSKGRMYIGAGRLVYTFNGFSYKVLCTSPAGDVTAMATDDSGNLWLGTSAGLYRYESPSGLAPVTSGGPSSRISCLLKEPGGLWVGTPVGLARFDGRSWRRFGAESGLTASDVRSMARFDGRLWIGTDRGVFVAVDGRRFRQVSPLASDVLGAGASGIFSAGGGRLVYLAGRQGRVGLTYSVPATVISAIQVFPERVVLATDRGLMSLPRSGLR